MESSATDLINASWVAWHRMEINRRMTADAFSALMAASASPPDVWLEAVERYVAALREELASGIKMKDTSVALWKAIDIERAEREEKR